MILWKLVVLQAFKNLEAVRILVRDFLSNNELFFLFSYSKLIHAIKCNFFLNYMKESRAVECNMLPVNLEPSAYIFVKIIHSAASGVGFHFNTGVDADVKWLTKRSASRLIWREPWQKHKKQLITSSKALSNCLVFE